MKHAMVRISEAIHHLAKVEAAKRKITMRVLIEKAIKKYVGKEKE